MSFSDFFSDLRRYNENASVIFDAEEPIGRATDLVMPRRRWFVRRLTKSKAAPARSRKNLPNEQ